ncbi:carbohydrate esterase family 8 protein [Amanita thiersii Skay4041]|uniref:pectinesterase n=1 Tax=Amanita thiersii Skay4041 TaxID=703135 RepID=A0A2A9NS40_9AGAR|nr:carbohydrate esterase family 8 protein [Amanita thiersii Skay4041]
MYFAVAALLLTSANGLSPRSIAWIPLGLIYISQDPEDKFARFHSVQDAIKSLGEATNLVAAGEYHETMNITRTGPLTLLIWNSNFVHIGMDDATSAVLTIAPSFNASLIGAGPTGAPLQPLSGNTDFKAYNIDFQNRAANFSISQALVTDISYANASFYGRSFASYQDTWYTGRNASTYVVDSIIYGQTDYLFGFGTVWFQNVVLANRACGGGIVAWKGTNQTDAPGNRYGAYISNSQNNKDANVATITTGQCFLGRPWNDLATTVYLNTFMDDSIRPEGWTPFNNDRPGEFPGPGGNASTRVPIGHLLTAQEAEKFTVDKVFLGRPTWIDFEYLF